MSIGIPSLDLADFLNDDVVKRKAFVESLGRAYEDIGFVAIRNHGLSDALVAELYRQVEAFFQLPENIKRKYDLPGAAGQRGYTPFGREHAKGKNAGDLKEFWQFGQYNPPVNDQSDDYPDNVEVEELPEFNSMGREAYQTLEQTGVHILRALAIYIGLDENYFDGHVKGGNSILRAIHYPPITAEPGDAVRAAEHEDINLITLLMGASADGLQVLNRAGEWVSVTALPEMIVVNVGDMLQRLTNNKLRSTTHRVINPPKSQWSKPRFSIPFFLHPRSEMPLNCLPECISENSPRVYDDTTAGQYLDERLREIGLKK
ncbi:MAG: isopenicillin N synthase family oxygenase [Cryomorphaceae bacterium]|nr:isopenicillin N synthase family oxygenase [Cryomorphaceae bacterium]